MLFCYIHHNLYKLEFLETGNGPTGPKPRFFQILFHTFWERSSKVVTLLFSFGRAVTDPDIHITEAWAICNHHCPKMSETLSMCPPQGPGVTWSSLLPPRGSTGPSWLTASEMEDREDVLQDKVTRGRTFLLASDQWFRKPVSNIFNFIIMFGSILKWAVRSQFLFCFEQDNLGVSFSMMPIVLKKRI